MRGNHLHSVVSDKCLQQVQPSHAISPSRIGSRHRRQLGVYYSHKIGATRPFEEAVPREMLEKKVRTYLKESAALEKFWSTRLTSDMLAREVQRMTGQSRMPQRLRELYSALRNDPFTIQECLARPVLADRLTRSFFAQDRIIHAARTESEGLRQDLAEGAPVLCEEPSAVGEMDWDDWWANVE